MEQGEWLPVLGRELAGGTWWWGVREADLGAADCVQGDGK